MYWKARVAWGGHLPQVLRCVCITNSFFYQFLSDLLLSQYAELKERIHYYTHSTKILVVINNSILDILKRALMIFSHLLVCDSVQRCGSLRYVVEFAEPTNHAYIYMQIYIPSEQIQVGTISVFLIFRCKYKRHDHETHAQSSGNCFLNSREYFLFEATWKVNIANYVLAVFMPLAMYVLWVSKCCQGTKVLLCSGKWKLAFLQNVSFFSSNVAAMLTLCSNIGLI